jgi:hypothetical protein
MILSSLIRSTGGAGIICCCNETSSDQFDGLIVLKIGRIRIRKNYNESGSVKPKSNESERIRNSAHSAQLMQNNQQMIFSRKFMQIAIIYTVP